MTSEQKAFHDWYDNLKPAEQKLVDAAPADRQYRIRTIGFLCYVESYEEDGTVSVIVPIRWNPGTSLRNDEFVFGVPPEKLEDVGPLPPLPALEGDRQLN